MSSNTSKSSLAGDKRIKKSKKSRFKPRLQHRIKPAASNHNPLTHSSDDHSDDNEEDLESKLVPEVSGDDNVTKDTSQRDIAPDHAADDQHLPRKRPRITLKLSKQRPSSSPPDERTAKDVGEQNAHDHQAPVAAVSQDAPPSSREQSLRALTTVYDHYLGYREIDAGSLVNTKKFILNRTCPQWMLSYQNSPAVQPWQSAQLNRALARPSISPVLPGIASFPDPFSCSGTPSSVGCCSPGQASAVCNLRSHTLLDRPAGVAGAPMRHAPATRPKLPRPSSRTHFLIHEVRQSQHDSQSMAQSQLPTQALIAYQKPNEARRIGSMLLNDDDEALIASSERRQAEPSNTPVQADPCNSSRPQPSVGLTQSTRPKSTPEITGKLAVPVHRSSQARDGIGPGTSSGTGQEADRPTAGYMHIPEGWTRNAVIAAESYREKHG